RQLPSPRTLQPDRSVPLKSVSHPSSSGSVPPPQAPSSASVIEPRTGRHTRPIALVVLRIQSHPPLSNFRDCIIHPSGTRRRRPEAAVVLANTIPGGRTMRSFIRIPLALMAGAAVAPVALAHHGFGTFVMDEDIEITGTVTGLDFVNPHSWLYLDVVDENGETVAMRCEMRSANTLRRSGWSPDLFPEGKEVTITGSPDRDDPYSCYVSTVIFDDGSSLDRYGQITAPADIGQGERPPRLANGEPNISGDWAQEQRIMTDPRGQRGTLVPLSEAARYADDPEAAGVIGGARGTEQAAARAEALRLAREGLVESAAEAEAAARAAAAAAGG